MFCYTWYISSKQPYEIFPCEVWEVVVGDLSLQDAFTLARTSKSMWEHLRHVPFEGTWDIQNNDLVVPSFLLSNVKHVHATINVNVSYSDLRQLLCKFYQLDSVTLSCEDVEITASTANKLVLCLPMKRGHHKVILYVQQCDRSYFQEAVTKSGKNWIILRSIKRKYSNDEGDDKEESEKRRRRTPTPIRGDVKELEEKIEDIKQTFGSIAADPAKVVPTALTTYCGDYEFADVDTLLSSIVVSSKGAWMYVTQVEAYMRGASDIDDCANNTITIGNTEKPKFIVEQKREYQNQWLEAKVYFLNFEFLVTGCLCGDYASKEFDAFLEASLGNRLACDDYWRIYVPVEPVPVVKECRLLRNFAKRASGFQWLLKSQRFHENGFSTTCALSLCELNGIDSIVAVGSLLLSWKALGQQNKQLLRSMLSDVVEMKGLDVGATIESVKRVRELDLAKGKKSALEVALLVLNDDNVKDVEYVEMYKSLISSRLITLNKKAIRQKKYLLH